MIFRNLNQFSFDDKLTSLTMTEGRRTISLVDECDFFGSDYAMYDDETTRAELNWTVFSDASKTKAEEVLSIYFHDVQSFAIKNGKGTSADEDKEFDFLLFKISRGLTKHLLIKFISLN